MRREKFDGLDGNGLLKTYALSMEDKMAAGAFGRARNYGLDGPFNILTCTTNFKTTKSQREFIKQSEIIKSGR